MLENKVGIIICCLNCIHKTRNQSDAELVYCNNTQSPTRGNWMHISAKCNEFEGQVTVCNDL